MAPVIFALRRQPGLTPVVLVTGQHREQLAPMLALFGITPDVDLAAMRARQTLPELLGRLVPQATAALRQLACDYVLVHGDTLSTFAVALAAFYEGIPLGHVEAGLRSFNLREPFPEEANRRLTDVLTDLDLPPTPLAAANLLREGKPPTTMVITGNTAVDAVHYALAKAQLPEALAGQRLVYLTMHRRENLPVMRQLAEAIAEVARAFPEFTFVYPVHLNPAVREAVWPALAPVANVQLKDPFDFLTSLAVQRAAELIVTDSGGIQEEGSALGTPVVVLRNVTERPEGVSVGTLRLAGNDPAQVKAVLCELLGDPQARQAMRDKPNPYGDGRAGLRVAQAVAWRLGLAERPADWQASPLAAAKAP